LDGIIILPFIGPEFEFYLCPDQISLLLLLYSKISALLSLSEVLTLSDLIKLPFSGDQMSSSFHIYIIYFDSSSITIPSLNYHIMLSGIYMLCL